ncbi:Hypothetical protein NocV09_00100440 [Nannochloropsis oceanica]
MSTPPGRSNTTALARISSDEQLLRDFREAKQSILTSTTAHNLATSPPPRRTAELNLGDGQLQREITSIVEMPRLERAAAASERKGDDDPFKWVDEQSDVRVNCVPAADPLSPSGVSSRASSPNSTSSSEENNDDERSASSCRSRSRANPITSTPSLYSSSSSSSSSPSSSSSSSFSSPPQSQFFDASMANKPFSFAEELQWPRKQDQQFWQHQPQEQPQPAQTFSIPFTRAATTPAAAHSTSLLAMLQEEKEQGRQQAARIKELELACVEIQQECQVAIAAARLESHELKCMLRRMASESTFADVFQVYEAHIARVEQEVQILRARNIHLEERRQQHQSHQQQQEQQRQQEEEEKEEEEEEEGLQPTSVGQNDDGEGHDHSINDGEEDRDGSIHHNGNSSLERRGLLSVGTTAAAKLRQSLKARSDVVYHHGKCRGHECKPSSSTNAKSKHSISGAVNGTPKQYEAGRSTATASMTALRCRIKDLQRQVDDFKKETGELRRRERQSLVQKRVVETTWARVMKVQAMAKGLEGSLASSRLEGARAEARLEEAEEEIRVLRQREAALVLDRDKLLLELDLLHRKQLGGGGNGPSSRQGGESRETR